MPRNSKLHPVERTDLHLAHNVELDRNSILGRATARFAELGDQPPLLALSVGVVVTVAGVAIGVAVSFLARLLVPPFDEIEQPA